MKAFIVFAAVALMLGGCATTQEPPPVRLVHVVPKDRPPAECSPDVSREPKLPSRDLYGDDMARGYADMKLARRDLASDRIVCAAWLQEQRKK